VPTWHRNSAVSSPVNSHQYAYTNNTVPNTKPIVSNLIFDDLFLWFRGEFSEYYSIYFKDVTSMFYYF